jgi:hypothetical protein
MLTDILERRWCRFAAGTWAALAIVLVAGSALPSSLLLNGGFESGVLGAWNAAPRVPAIGFFAIDSDNSVNLTGLPTPGPAAGNYHAVSDQVDPASFILWQAFTVPPDSSVSVSYQLFANSYAPVAVGVSNLDHTNPNPNQHARVDVIALSDFMSDNYRTSGSVLNLWIGGTQTDLGDPSNPWVALSHDITGFTGGGGSFVLRYGVVANQNVFNLGVDEVGITTSPIPESPTFATVGVVTVCMAVSLLRRGMGR